MRQSKRHLLPTHPRVIAVVDTPVAMKIAHGLKPGSVDAVEIRSDCLTRQPERAELAAIKFPLIATARHPAEGGMRQLSDAARRERLLRLMPYLDFVDIELRSLKVLDDVIQAARAAKVRVLLSHHDFSGTPGINELRGIVKRAEAAGGDIIKIASVTKTAGDVARLLNVFENPPGVPLAVMGMGPLGMASRLLFAACGSVLNYGWLDRPGTPGQWPAVEFKNLLKKIPRIS